MTSNMISSVEYSTMLRSSKEFDLYSHMKSNIKLQTSICEIHESDLTIYCVTCKRSICEVCRDSYHSSHIYLEKEDIANHNRNIVSQIFYDLEKKIVDTDIFSQPKKTLLELSESIEKEFEIIQERINELKLRRLKEIETIFGIQANDSKKLFSCIKKTKDCLFQFIDTQKSFYVGKNDDVDNFSFLSMYDLINELDLNTKEYHDMIAAIIKQFEKYETIVNKKYCNKIQSVIEECIEEQKKLEIMTSNMIVLERENPDKINIDFIDKTQEIPQPQPVAIDPSSQRQEKLKTKKNLVISNNEQIKNTLANSYDKLNEDIYESLRAKIMQVQEHNQTFKVNVFDSFKKTGSLIEIEKMLKIYEDKTSKRVQYNAQVNQVKISQSKGSGLTRSKQILKLSSLVSPDKKKDKDEEKTTKVEVQTKKVESIKEEEDEDRQEQKADEGSDVSFNDKDDQIDVGISKNKKLYENKELLRINNMFKPKQKPVKPEKNIIHSLPTKKEETDKENNEKYHNKLVDILKENQKLSEMIKSKDDCNLKIISIRKFYSYSILEFIRKNFYKANKNQSSHILFTQQYENTSHSLDSVRVFEGTSDIQIFDREKRKIIRKTIKIDKKKFGTSVFFNGCRTFFCMEKLYISGGKDTNGDKNSFWSYDIKEDKLEKLINMTHARSFHTMVYHENLRSLMVFGGENNASCEMYDFYLNLWNVLPDMNFPRANVQIYLDKVGTFGYAICGIVGLITSPNPVFSDQIELLDLVDMNNGWAIVDYYNKNNVDLKVHENRIYPLTDDKLLVYGAFESRTIQKTYCIFDLRTFFLQSVGEEELGEFKIKSILNPTKSEKVIEKTSKK